MLNFLGLAILKGDIQVIRKPSRNHADYNDVHKLTRYLKNLKIAIMITHFVPVTTRIMIPWTGAIENIKSPLTKFNVRLTLGTLKPIKKVKM